MGNTIKYNTNSESKALKVNNFWIGTGDVDKGPTENTGFYNSVNPPSNGYTIYLNKATGGPSIYVANNDAQLIDLTNKIANTNYTGVTQCFDYFRGQSDKALFNREIGDIITDGLILNLDAGFVGSYPQSGSTWHDLSGNGNNATLNDTSFNSDNGGNIVFTKSANYGVVNNNELARIGTTNHTITIWVKNNQKINEDIIGTGTETGDILLMIFNSDNQQYGRFRGHVWSSTGNANTIDSPNEIGTGNWNMLTQRVTWGGNIDLFENGQLVATQALNGSAPTSSRTQLVIGNRNVDSSPGSFPGRLDGKLAMAQIYNRSLSNAEILQNYNALKGRFEPSIVTSGLVLNLDAGNPASYPGTGTIWTDLSGNGNHGTLTNGPTFNSNNGGSIFFDGIDDYVINSSCNNFPQGSSARTVQMWVKFNGNTNNILQIGQEGTGVPGGVYIVENLNLFTGHFLFTDGSHGENNITISGGEIPSTNTWVNFTFLHSYPNWYYYLNGTLIKSGTFGVQFNTQGQKYVLGRRFDAFGQPLLNGNVATLFVYNKALTGAEVLQNYNAQKSRFGL